MIKKNNDGYYFESENGIIYDLLEGVTMGTEPQKTSDIIFVVISGLNLEIDTPEEHFVGYLYGASFMNDCMGEYEGYISYMVEEYEKKYFLKEN